MLRNEITFPKQPNTVPKMEMAEFELGVPASEPDSVPMRYHDSIMNSQKNLLSHILGP